MRKTMASVLSLGVVGLALASCTGTTGDALLTFSAYAVGSPGASKPFTVAGYSIQLTEAKMHIGAVYVDESPLPTGAEGPTCLAPGVYAAQVAGPVDVDLLATRPQEFSVYGNGSADTGLSWQIWMTDGDVNEANITSHMVDVQGTATRISDGQAFTFGSVVTINDNRKIPTTDPSQPGQNPICKQRILLIGPIGLTLFQGGVLTVTVDPRQWFESASLDFATLPAVTDANCLTGDDLVPLTPADYGTAAYCIPNTNYASGAGAEQGQQFFSGIQTGGSGQFPVGAYSVGYAKEAQ